MGIVNINDELTFVFNNNVDFCVGTGRLGLGLTKEYLEELKFVQDEIGFKLIRGHGLFSDDVAIYHEYEENGVKKVEYNYTYIDRIFDEYLKLKIEPYLELGFMPEKLASGTQTIFYWKGQTTPPKDYSMWTDMVVALLQHLVKRYGERVYNWPIEVWNEPNLPGFWYKADMQEYFKLFKETYIAIKAFDNRFKVGGPAVCGVKEDVWIKAFLEFCNENNLKPDYITRHHYTVEFPDRIGHYDYSKLEDANNRFDNLQSTRDIIDSFEEFKDTPIHITEFSTSYTPRGVIHDTNLNAAYIAGQLARLGDVNDLYSYWTFGDVFEEEGVPFTLFHGGFGMVAANCIPKPTFWTFAFFKELKEKGEKCVWKDDSMIVLKTNSGYIGVLWNTSEEDAEKDLVVRLDGKQYVFAQKDVDEECCNPLKMWHNLGEPANPGSFEVRLIKDAATPNVSSKIVETHTNELSVHIVTKKHGVKLFELMERKFTPDRGYDYEKVLSFH